MSVAGHFVSGKSILQSGTVHYAMVRDRHRGSFFAGDQHGVHQAMVDVYLEVHRRGNPGHA